MIYMKEGDKGQAVKSDADKLPMMLTMPAINEAVVRARVHGISKYGNKDNWKEVEKERWQNALIRHIMLYIEDPDGVDAESGLTHLTHVAFNVAAILEMEKEESQKKHGL